MITENRKIELMTETIELAKKSIDEKGKLSPKVGALLANSDGEILMSCFRGETGVGHHCEYGLLEKCKRNNIELKRTVLFVTLEPCVSTDNGKISCAQRIIESGINEVYIGTLDPNPVLIGKGEMCLRANKLIVNRYPNDLIEKLNEINSDFFDRHKDTFLPNNSLFMTKNVPQIILEYLNKQGYSIDENLPNDWNTNIDYISAYCHFIEKDTKTLNDIMNAALGYAYDKKYFSHDYKCDVRGSYKQWVSTFKDILQELNVASLNYLRTLIVGVGNGQEGQYLYSDVEDLTLVDIAPKSLYKAKRRLNTKQAYVMNAQNLHEIDSCSMEAYISLLTYQSTYFDMDRALVEAYRVLKKDGIIIISIASGFMKEKNVYIDGLIDPQNGSIDRNRPYDLIDDIRRMLISFNFVSLGIRTTPSEIFIYARKSR